MNHLLLTLAALGLFSSGQNNTPKDIWIETSEGWYPRITKSSVEGTVAKSGDQIGAEFQRTDHGWLVSVSRQGRVQVRLRLSATRFADIHPQDARLMTTLDEKVVRLKIPYGEAQEECFANGSDVYASLHVSVRGNAPPMIYETRFENCEGRTEEPARSEEKGVVVIGK